MDNLNAFKELDKECETMNVFSENEVVVDTSTNSETEVVTDTETTAETLVGNIVIPVETNEEGELVEIVVTDEFGEPIETVGTDETDIEVLTNIEKNTSDTLMVLKYFVVIILVLILFRCLYKFVAKWLFGGV